MLLNNGTKHINYPYSQVIGLESFLKTLEFNYFSQIKVRSCSSSEYNFEMGLDFHCPISLLDLLAQFNKGIWGNNQSNISPLKTSFLELTSKNCLQLDIDELTLYLLDTNIVIKKINGRSIIEQLNNILTEIAKQYVFLTIGLTEKPYEIFVSIDEEYSVWDTDSSTRTNPSSYFKFWGVYFESKEDAMIYDLENNKYIPADLDFYVIDEI